MSKTAHGLPTRRRFLMTLAATVPSAYGLAALIKNDSESAGGLPPIRTITKGPKFHWRGYYDKLLFSHQDRFVLANEVDFEHRSPRPEDVIRVGMVDLENKDEWIELGSARAWNWQQGCMLQWIPGSRDEVMWNDREGDQFVCHIINVRSGKKRTIPHAIYTLSPDGKYGLSTDFRRLNDCRPGYGYAGIPDPNRDVLAPENAGIWRVNLRTGEAKMLFSLAEISAIPWEAGTYGPEPKSWFNHLLYNQDGSRFIFLHRWRAYGKGNFFTRMITASARDGSDRYVIDPSGATSHFVWADPKHVFMFTKHASKGLRFYMFKDKTREVEPVGPEVMTVNGHNTLVPHTRSRWVLNDTYPDRNRLQHPFLYHRPTNRRVDLGHFHLPVEYKEEWRCDTHPCASRNGKMVAIDSPHTGQGRQVHLIDISKIVG